MSNVSKATPGVKLTLGGKVRTLKFTLGAFAKLERVTGKNSLTSEAWENPDATTIVALVWAALNDPAVTMDQVGDWITMAEVTNVTEAIQAAMMEAVPEGDGAKNEVSPQAPTG